MHRPFVIFITLILFLATCGLTQLQHDPAEETHDESNCATCVMFHAPLLIIKPTPLALFPGVIVGFLLLRQHAIAEHAPQLSISCRGPPH